VSERASGEKGSWYGIKSASFSASTRRGRKNGLNSFLPDSSPPLECARSGGFPTQRIFIRRVKVGGEEGRGRALSAFARSFSLSTIHYHHLRRGGGRGRGNERGRRGGRTRADSCCSFAQSFWTKKKTSSSVPFRRTDNLRSLHARSRASPYKCKCFLDPPPTPSDAFPSSPLCESA